MGDWDGVQAVTVREDSSSNTLSLVRKLMHVALAVVPLLGWLVSFDLAVALAAALVAVSLALEAARRWWPWVNRLLWRVLPTVFRAWEGQKVLGSTWYAVGVLAALLFYGRDAGGTAVLFLAWGDPAAEIIGRRWGRRGQRKTVAGTGACLFACLLAGAVGASLGGLPLWAVLAGALAATAVERWSPPPDDNLWIPVLSGGAIVMAQLVPRMMGR